MKRLTLAIVAMLIGGFAFAETTQKVLDDQAAVIAGESDSQDKPDASPSARPADRPVPQLPDAVERDDQPQLELASVIMARRLWAVPSVAEVQEQYAQLPAEWVEIAKIADLVLDDDERVLGYVADVGGFLGIGGKRVLIKRADLVTTTVNNSVVFVTDLTRAELEAAPEFALKRPAPPADAPVPDTPTPDAPATDVPVNAGSAPASDAADGAPADPAPAAE